MLATFLIMLREGLEAALIISIAAIFLARMGKQDLFKYLYIGIAIAAALCLDIGAFFHFAQKEFPEQDQELIKGYIGVVAVCVLIWMVFWMRKTGHKIKGELEEKLNNALEQGNNAQAKILISMAFFAVLREGIESVLFLFAASQSSNIYSFFGAALGLLLAIAIGIAIYKGSRKINIAKFFHYTSIAIIVFASGLAATSLRKFTEAGMFSSLQQSAYDLHHVIPNNSALGAIFGSFFGYSDSPAVAEVIVFFSVLIITLSAFFIFKPKRPIKKEVKTVTNPQTENAIGA